MDAGQSAHPNPETLQAYGLGMLDDASAEVVSKHLDDCTECQRRVSEITAASSADSSVSPTGKTADYASLESSSSPRMSSTGQADVTSDDLNSPNETSLPFGTRVGYFGDYELLKVLGEGGMGIVYKARQLSLNRLVALKMIKASRFPSSDEVRRFQNEAEAVARLDHPNIVPIFEVGRYEDQHYFSMKLIAGESLDKRLKQYVADPQRAARLAAVTAGAILHAHQRGILHRDLKPANILVDSEGQPHVSDFGLAKRIEGDSELTRSGAIVGTPAYMAPEQASGSRGAITTSTDVYGLGAILFALLTGRAPFGGTTVVDVLEQVRERTPDSPRKINPRVPRNLEVICLKCLEKDPRRRYASADAFGEDLKRWLAGEPIAARPVGSTARFWMWCHRNPVVAGAAGLVAAALVVVAVLSLLYARQQAQLAAARKLYADEQTQRGDEQASYAREQAEAARKIADMAQNLQKESHNLKTSLADSNRRLAILHFETRQRAFDSGQVNHGLIRLVETWRYAIKANDPAWQSLARTNLSFWRYNCPEIKWVFSDFIAVDPAGKMIVTRRGESVAQLWDVATCQPIGEPMVHPSKIEAVAFSPDNKTILTTSYPKSAQLWDARSGHPIGKPIENHFNGYKLPASFSPDSKTVITHHNDETARLWDAATGRPIGSPIKCHHLELAWFSSDGNTFHTGAGRRWDTASGKSLGAMPTLSHQGEAYAIVAVSPDGKSVLAADRLIRTYRLWDAASGQPIGKPMVHKRMVSSSTFSADGTTIATVDVDIFNTPLVQLWNAATGLPIGPSSAHAGVVNVSFSPDGKTVAVSCGLEGKVGLLDAGTGLPVSKPLEHQALIESVAFSPDGKTVLTASDDKTARLWDAATGQPLGEPIAHEELLESAAFCADGKFVLTDDGKGTARLWKLFTDRPMGKPLELLHLAGPIEFSTDGKFLRMTGKDRMTLDDLQPQLWDAATGSPIAQPSAERRNGAGLQFRPDAARFIDLSADKAARLWDAATEPPARKPVGREGVSGTKPTAPDRTSSRLVSVAHSHDGMSFLTLVDDRVRPTQLRLWNAATNQPIGQSIELRHSKCTGFSPDMKTILTVAHDHRAHLTDAVTGRAIGPPLVHPTGGGPGEMAFAVFGPDGKTVATACNKITGLASVTSANSTIRIWHLPSILDNDFPRFEVWAQTFTGLAADDDGNVRALDAEAWLERRERLRQLGGQPKSDSRWLSDPILYGADPTARGRAWTERKCWVEAEAAFSEVVRARPLRSSAWRERARFYVMRSEPGKAAGDFLKARALGDRAPELFAEICASDGVVDRLLTLIPEDAISLSIDFLFQTAEILAVQGRFDEARAALVRVVRPSAVADWAVPLELPLPAQLYIFSAMKPSAPNTLGAALYRARRFEDAIRQLKEGIEARKEAEQPFDWIFLAMANHRLGHHDEARRWLDRLRNRQPRTDLNPFWEELAIRLLRSEADAVILYDPIFPADPFAH